MNLSLASEVEAVFRGPSHLLTGFTLIPDSARTEFQHADVRLVGTETEDPINNDVLLKYMLTHLL